MPRRGKGRPTDAVGFDGRRVLIEAARELLKVKAPAQVTRSEIARAANVDAALVSYHFGSKDDLLTAVAAEVSQEMHRRMDRAIAEGRSAEEKLRNRIGVFMEIHRENPHLNQLMIQQIVSGKGEAAQRVRTEMIADSVTTLAAVLDEGVACGELRETDVRMLHVALIGMCDFFFTGRAVVRELFGEDVAEAELATRYGEFIGSLILRALRPAAAPSAASRRARKRP